VYIFYVFLDEASLKVFPCKLFVRLYDIHSMIWYFLYSNYVFCFVYFLLHKCLFCVFVSWTVSNNICCIKRSAKDVLFSYYILYASGNLYLSSCTVNILRRTQVTKIENYVQFSLVLHILLFPGLLRAGPGAVRGVRKLPAGRRLPARLPPRLLPLHLPHPRFRRQGAARRTERVQEVRYCVQGRKFCTFLTVSFRESLGRGSCSCCLNHCHGSAFHYCHDSVIPWCSWLSWWFPWLT
jgi:hypothetical protein